MLKLIRGGLIFNNALCYRGRHPITIPRYCLAGCNRAFWFHRPTYGTRTERTRPMLKPLIAGITALSLSFATATPTQAEGMTGDDVGKLIIGIAAIAALNAALESNDRDDARRPARVDHRRSSWADLNRPRHREETRRNDLPRQCLQTVDTRFGTYRLFGKSCLERDYARVNRLPDRCAVRLYTEDGPRSGFDPLCLRDAGYRSTRRH